MGLQEPFPQGTMTPMDRSAYESQLLERAVWESHGLPVLVADVESPCIQNLLTSDGDRERARRDLFRQVPLPLPPRGGDYFEFCGYATIERESVSVMVGGVRPVWKPGREGGVMCYDWYRFAWVPDGARGLKPAGGWLWEGGQTEGPGGRTSRKHPEDRMFVVLREEADRARAAARQDPRVDAFLSVHQLGAEAREGLNVVEWYAEFPQDAGAFAAGPPQWNLRVSEVIAPRKRVTLSALVSPAAWQVARVETGVYMEFGR